MCSLCLAIKRSLEDMSAPRSGSSDSDKQRCRQVAGPIIDSVTQNQVGVVSWGDECSDPAYPTGSLDMKW